jgi:transposase-like protein
MRSPAAKPPYAGYRFPAEVISHAVWLYFRFPLSLRMVEERHRQVVGFGLTVLTSRGQC